VIFYDTLVIVSDTVLQVALEGVIAIGAAFLILPLLYLLELARILPIAMERPTPALAENELPHVLVQLPIFNEGNLTTGLLRTVAALDWPKDRLHIQLLDDSTDDTTETAAAEIMRLRRNGFHADHLRRTHRSGFKAGALAAGLAMSEADFVAMLDADYRPPTDWLRVVIPRFAAYPRAAFIQSRCEFMNSNSNWLTRAQSLLFDAHFVMEQGVRARAGILFQFNGTGGIWRRAAIEAAGGWSPDSLCEDLDLTVRAALKDWHGVFVMHPPVAGLVPDQMRHWRVQQRRWASGFAQIARKLTWPIWRSHWSVMQKLLAGFLILYQAIFPVATLASVAFVVDLVLHRGHLPPVLLLLEVLAVEIVLVAVGMTLPPYLELHRGGIGRYLRTVVALPPLILYLSFANARPIVAAFFGRSEVFKRTPKAVADR